MPWGPGEKPIMSGGWWQPREQRGPRPPWQQRQWQQWQQQWWQEPQGWQGWQQPWPAAHEGERHTRARYGPQSAASSGAGGGRAPWLPRGPQRGQYVPQEQSHREDHPQHEHPPGEVLTVTWPSASSKPEDSWGNEWGELRLEAEEAGVRMRLRRRGGFVRRSNRPTKLTIIGDPGSVRDMYHRCLFVAKRVGLIPAADLARMMHSRIRMRDEVAELAGEPPEEEEEEGGSDSEAERERQAAESEEEAEEVRRAVAVAEARREREPEEEEEEEEAGEQAEAPQPAAAAVVGLPPAGAQPAASAAAAAAAPQATPGIQPKPEEASDVEEMVLELSPFPWLAEAPVSFKRFCIVVSWAADELLLVTQQSRPQFCDPLLEQM